MPTKSIMLIVVFLLVYIIFFIWYGGKGKPVTTSEIDFYINKIRNHHNAQNQKDSDLLIRLRNMAEQDDGKSFHMVNLIQYKQRNNENLDVDPMKANSRYGKNILPILLKNGCHPIFSSSVKCRFIEKGSDVEWDNVSIVRYRSMRDFLKVTSENSIKGVDKDKWLSIEKTQVFPTKAIIDLTLIRFNVTVILALIVILIYLLLLS